MKQIYPIVMNSLLTSLAIWGAMNLVSLILDLSNVAKNPILFLLLFAVGFLLTSIKEFFFVSKDESPTQ